MATREDIWSALFTILSGAADFQTMSRRVKLMPDNTPMMPLNQPAMYLLEGNETRVQGGRGTPDKQFLNAQVWIFAKIPALPGDTPGATVLNPLLDAIDAVMVPDDALQNVMTLGGLVSHCWIEGETIKVVGDLNPDGQCFASIPIKILIP